MGCYKDGRAAGGSIKDASGSHYRWLQQNWVNPGKNSLGIGKTEVSATVSDGDPSNNTSRDWRQSLNTWAMLRATSKTVTWMWQRQKGRKWGLLLGSPHPWTGKWNNVWEYHGFLFPNPKVRLIYKSISLFYTEFLCLWLKKHRLWREPGGRLSFPCVSGYEAQANGICFAKNCSVLNSTLLAFYNSLVENMSVQLINRNCLIHMNTLQ